MEAVHFLSGGKGNSSDVISTALDGHNSNDSIKREVCLFCLLIILTLSFKASKY